MKLSYDDLKKRNKWLNVNISIPQYDIESVVKRTYKTPEWVHFGAGNIFRGFIAKLQEELLNKGLADKGIIAVDTFDKDIIDKIYRPYDNLSLVVGLKPDGNTVDSIVGCITESIWTDSESFSRLKDIFSNPSLKMISTTITEKGYALNDIAGNIFGIVKEDIENGPSKPVHAMSIITSLLYHRYLAGGHKLAVVSMDNCSRNGETFMNSVMTIAKAWCEKGHVDAGFIEYLNDGSRISFPWTMIDKITPRPSKVIEEMLNKKGVEDISPVITEKKTFIAPYVNAEIPQYLVIEDDFPNGRPSLEHAGVYFTDRGTVNAVEKMKVTTCLNPLHTALAVFGCVLGYKSIAEEMKDPMLKKLVMHIGYDEGLPVVSDPGIISPRDFINEVIEERLPNPFIPDMPQRIATDSSQKIPIRFGTTIRAYIDSDTLDVKDLTYIPLAIAGWLRYLIGVDDNGNPIELSTDPLLDDLKAQLDGIKLGQPETVGDKLKPILSNKTLFANDLCEAGLYDKIHDMFILMITSKGAVRKTLENYLLM